MNRPDTGPGQGLTANTVKHLVVGSGLAFTSLGNRAPSGVPGEWTLDAAA